MPPPYGGGWNSWNKATSERPVRDASQSTSVRARRTGARISALAEFRIAISDDSRCRLRLRSRRCARARPCSSARRIRRRRCYERADPDGCRRRIGEQLVERSSECLGVPRRNEAAVDTVREPVALFDCFGARHDDGLRHGHRLEQGRRRPGVAVCANGQCDDARLCKSFPGSLERDVDFDHDVRRHSAESAHVIGSRHDPKAQLWATSSHGQQKLEVALRIGADRHDVNAARARDQQGETSLGRLRKVRTPPAARRNRSIPAAARLRPQSRR